MFVSVLIYIFLIAALRLSIRLLTAILFFKPPHQAVDLIFIFQTSFGEKGFFIFAMTLSTVSRCCLQLKSNRCEV